MLRGFNGMFHLYCLRFYVTRFKENENVKQLCFSWEQESKDNIILSERIREGIVQNQFWPIKFN